MGGCGSRNDEVSLYRKKQKISLPGMCQTISFNFDATLLAASFFKYRYLKLVLMPQFISQISSFLI